MFLLMLAALLPIVSVLHPASALARPATALARPSAAAAITCQSTAHDYCRRSSVRMDAVVAEGTSVITCGRCKAAYAVAPDAFGPVGKQVRCSNCGHEWFQSASRHAHSRRSSLLPSFLAMLHERRSESAIGTPQT